MDTFFDAEFFISNSLHVLVTLFVLTLLFHIPLFFGKNLTKAGWKKVDYIWLSVAAVALIGSASEVRTFVAGNWLQHEKRLATTSLKSLTYFTLSVNEANVCTTFKLKLKPEESKACMWFSDTGAYLASLDSESIPELQIQPYVQLSKGDWLYQDYDQFSTLLNIYEMDYSRVQKTSKAVGKSSTEIFLWYLSPFLLCISLAIRLTKVTGEVMLEQS
ncbi:hypothetical protein [Photobacterium sp. GSS17]|uniref:hypothetical protein n=1 Tax=Photobacterium sp. GSS17 TaxID=3020715 RepID=UPI002360C1EA|nr:hypothetical protein [Photobacterium sp. GSS17]